MAFPTVPTPVPRNGAVLVRKTAAHDVVFLRALTEGVQLAARQQEAAGEALDDVEVSTVTGRYDWRAYLHEELELALDRFRGEGEVP